MTTNRRRTATPHARNQNNEVLYHQQTQTLQQEFKQPIIQKADIAYISTSLQLLAFFVLTIYARTYFAMLTRELYPIVYSIAVGDVPSFYSLRYHLTYRPGLEYSVNTAYNYAPVVLTTSLFLVAKGMPSFVSGVKKTCSFLRNALVTHESDDTVLNVMPAVRQSA